MIQRLQKKLIHFLPWKYREDSDYQIEYLDQNTMIPLLDEIKKEKKHHIFIATRKRKTLLERLELVQAGGGMVINENNELLMIYRNGHWDLPKGKKDKGEKLKKTALREVEEETGVKGIKTGALLSKTYHWYFRKKWLLKETYWYSMHAKNQATTPEVKEGISKAEWLSQKQVKQYIPEMYPNVVRLVEDFFLD